MSAKTATTASGSAEVHVLHDEHQVGHGTMKGYITGFVLAVILTVMPFALVMGDVFANPRVTAFLVMGFAVVQIVVHMVYFLHMNTKSEGGWNMLALIFTLVLVVITIAGSLWVMYHLNTNMMQMPGHEMNEGGMMTGQGMDAMPGHDMSQMP
ncbi:cytochrome o ubiquinol oxidase subunit IV [Aureimonas sp. AU12]|uniref:cytochrome o ubiquinol oxidase subunit IV n=1 Tax=Aureimonas sp. AU12 TaxID=1638161 RepID=UPI0009EC436A|nr:cytochrome o ubiquinol oxidase subunit IV [Aureimonas sp. AU12]